jgi:spermidine synthase
MLLSGLLMAISVSVSQSEWLRFDSYKLFFDFSNVWKLVLSYLVFFLPFFFGALSIGLIFVKYVKKIGTLYFANMFGSGIGGLAAVMLMWFLMPEKLPAFISFLACFAGLLIVPQKLWSGFSLIISFVIAALVYLYINPGELHLSEYKPLSKTLNLPGSKIIKEKSSPYGLIDVIQSSHIRYAPGLSIKFPGTVSLNNAVFNNGNWYGALVPLGKDSINHFKHTTEYFPYLINKRKDVLILGAGTGRRITSAIISNASTITAVEQNKAVTKLLMNELAGEVDSVFNRKEVFPQNISPRTYLMKTSSKFDLISLPVIGSFGGSSGLFALQEQYDLTKEAFSEMWGRLNSEGVISVSTWIDYPYRKPLKVLSTVTEMLYDRGIKNSNEFIAAIKNWNTITFTIKRTAYNEEEIKIIREFCNNMNFDPVILPGIKAVEREKFNKLQDKSFYLLIDRILASPEEREKLYSEYLFNIKPAVDDKPYFSQFLQWKGSPQISKYIGAQSVPFFEVSYILLYLTFIQIVIFALILIILPLVKIGWRGGSMSWALFYFSGLGTGYMFLEIIFIQRFTLYFGNVIYAAAAVVSLMLIASGFGSLISQKLKAKPTRLVGIIFIIIISLVIYTIFLSSLLKTTIVFTLPIKIIFTTLLIAPPAFFMGMPFPLGLRLLSERNDSQVPWAWGINSLFSVISVVLATIIAIELGFVWVMIFAASAYGLSLSVNLKRS